MDIQITAYPTTSYLPEDLDRLKRFLRIEHDDEDDDLKELMHAAARQFTQLTGREVLYTQRTLRVPVPCGRIIELPYPNLLVVDSFRYIDTDGDEQDLDAGTDYLTHTGPMPGFVQLTDDGIAELGNATTDIERPVTVIYRSGFSTLSASHPAVVPAGIRQWIREGVRWLYEAKGRESDAGFPRHLIALADQWKVGRVEWAGHNG